MIAVGRYDHSLDAKNRLAIPSQVRLSMDPEQDGTCFYVIPEGRYLSLLPEKLFEKLAGQVRQGLAVSHEDAKARRLIFALASKLEPDKAGRVIIPDRYLLDSRNRDPFTEAVLGREVTLVGVGDRLELWNRADLASHLRELMAERPHLAATAAKMFGATPAESAGPTA